MDVLLAKILEMKQASLDNKKYGPWMLYIPSGYEALMDKDNWNSDGSVNWNFIDADLWMHDESENFSDEEKRLGLDNFPDELIPQIDFIN